MAYNFSLSSIDGLHLPPSPAPSVDPWGSLIPSLSSAGWSVAVGAAASATALASAATSATALASAATNVFNFDQCHLSNMRRKETPHSSRLLSDSLPEIPSQQASCELDELSSAFADMQLPEIPSPFIPPIRPCAMVAKKVFIGGIPIGTTAADLFQNLSYYGKCEITWPNRKPDQICAPNGYAFVIFEEELSARDLLRACHPDSVGRMALYIAIGGGRSQKTVELKFWHVKDAIYTGMSNWRQYARHSCFVGGLPRSVTADSLREVLEESIGQLAHVAIEADTVNQYPRGAARVVFVHAASFVKAVAMRELVITIETGTRKIELKPYVYQNMRCDKCRAAPGTLFCADVACLKYNCQACWKQAHSRPGMHHHRPL